MLSSYSGNGDRMTELLRLAQAKVVEDPISETKYSQAPVAHACNPNYSGGRDQKDHGSKPAQENYSMRPYLEKPFTTRGLVEWVKVRALSLSPSTTKKKKKRESCRHGSSGRLLA
jgi:hypothetical protein